MSQSQTEVNIRRAPKYLTFALTGFALGITAALFIGLGATEIVGLLVVIGGIAGGGVAILIALAFDIFYGRRGRKLPATKITE